MGPYEILELCVKILGIGFLLVVPWTFGLCGWVFLPGMTFLYGIGGFIGVLINEPGHMANAAKLHQAREVWATHLALGLGYLAYFVVVIWVSCLIGNMLLDREENKRRARFRRHIPPETVYVVIKPEQPPVPKAITMGKHAVEQHQRKDGS